MLLKAIMKLQDGETLENVDPVISMLLSIMEEEWKQDNDNYQKVCEKNRENVLKRWNNTKHTTVYDRIPLDTKHTDYDSDNDNDNIKENKISKDILKKKDIASVSELMKAYKENDLLSKRI
jgi:hypothetical protein